MGVESVHLMMSRWIAHGRDRSLLVMLWVCSLGKYIKFEKMLLLTISESKTPPRQVIRRLIRHEYNANERARKERTQ